MRPSLPVPVAARTLIAALALLVPAPLYTQARPASDTALQTGLRTLADTDSVRRPAVVIPGLELPFQVDLRLESNWDQFRNLRCTSAELFQASTRTGCLGGFVGPNILSTFSFRAAGTVKDRVHVDVDYDQQREFESSQVLSAYYEAPGKAKLQRVDLGNINFVAPTSRFMTSALPSGNYGLQITNQFGRVRLRSIFATQSGNVVQNKQFTIGGRTQQLNDHEISDFEIERLRFFFTIDPTLFGRAYPNVDILNRAQLSRIAASLPDTLRPTRVFLYRLQFGGQPQDPNGPRFRVRGDPGEAHQTYDVLREGVDYYMDPSQLWFALVRPLNQANERLVVAYNVRINGRDTIWTMTGGTPDLKATTAHDQVANMIMDPSIGTSSPAFRNEIRSVYRVAGENLVRQTTKVRIVTGSGLLEHPLAGGNATFLQMFGLAQPSNPADFDYENRLWPRRGDAVFNLGAGAADVRNGQSLDAAQIIRDYFLVFPSAQPFAAAARDSGLVTPGNPTNEAIYTTPGEYLYSPQHPASVYRLHFTFETAGFETFGTVMLGATQMRPNSERILLDGRPLVRGLDYTMNYDIGQVEFSRPDTLFRLSRRVEASYEENPVFAAATTRLAGFVSEVPVSHGMLTFAAIGQSQSNAQELTRPTLGFQGASTLTAGATGNFSWDAPALSRLVSKLPFGGSNVPSRISLVTEVASSRPQFAARNSNSAYLETFDADGGLSIPLSDVSWAYSSQPAYGRTLRSQFPDMSFEAQNASTVVWQTVPRSRSGAPITFTRSAIDPLLRFAGGGIESNEQVLWLTLLPLDKLGGFQSSNQTYRWLAGAGATTSGRRWRSIRTVLSPSGIDLTANEHLEFWALVDTTPAGLGKNPSLIFDFGDISENRLALAPTAMTITRFGNGAVDTLFTGKQVQSYDTLDTERDRFSHAFNADANDTGLPGDLVRSILVTDGTSAVRKTDVPICRATPSALLLLGDQNTNCTIGNHRLDEEDIDLDETLNLSSPRRESERLLRYVVHLSDASKFKRVGGAYTDSVFVNGTAIPRKRNWVLVSIPFRSPSESLNDVNRRRIRALRMTVVSGEQQDAGELTQFPIAGLRVTGAPWLNRSSQTLVGLGGVREDGGFSVLSTIGTNDSTTAVVYQPPPGIGDQPDSRLAAFAATRTVINESSMRIQAGNLLLYHRVEAFNRFPAGPQYFLGYEELRVWARGRGNGWGQNGDLQMFMKVGRDENNFYLRRSAANAGATQAAWTDVAVDFGKFRALRSRIEQDYLAGKKESIACTGLDSALVASTPVPSGVVVRRFAACDDGYIAYTTDPAVTAPNLGAVQELAVGIVRVGGGVTGPVLPDTLELWVDDIRLTHQVNTPGFAGQVGVTLNAGDFADLRLNVSNRDPNFRQLGEQPNFLGQRNVDMAMTLQLQKFLPPTLGVALPLTITKVAMANDPLYLSRSDISGHAIPGVRKPKNDLTTYSLTVRRTTPMAGMLGPLLDNLAATSTYVTGVDRTEFQDGNARNLSMSLDYLVTPDSAENARIPTWVDGALGALPQVMRAGPIDSFRGSTFRWNPTQFRLTSGIVRGDDRRVSFLTPSQGAADAPATSTAASRLWRNGSVLELRPTPSTTARWEAESIRDFRDYRDSAYVVSSTPQQINVAPGFERERTISSSFAIAPAFSAWLRPRADFGTQYRMVRDPNVRLFAPLPGVIGVDSVLARNDSLMLSRLLALPRRMTAAQTSSVGSTVDIAAAFRGYSRDSTLLRRIGGFFAPVDVSYTRSLLAALDASPVSAPLTLQLGLAGPASFRRVRGTNATTAGQTGTFAASGAILLPYGTALSNRYRRTTTLNWIARPDSSLANVDGAQTQFPDVALRWGLRPTASLVSAVETSVGYVRSEAMVSLPNLYLAEPPELRRTHAEQFPVSGSIAFAGRAAFSTRASYSHRRQTDSLPGSIARTRGDEFSVDAGGALHIPERLGLGLKNDVRTRFGVQSSRNLTLVADPSGILSSRLQDNGRLAYNLTADASVQEDATLTLQASYVVTYDSNVNHRYAQTVFSLVYQLKLIGGSR